MSQLADFLTILLRDGKAVLHGRPEPLQAADPVPADLLVKAFDNHALQVAGPPIGFDRDTALTAGRCVSHACWFLLSRDEPEAEVQRLVVLPGSPQSASQHLSADLVLRFLPALHRRARALNPADRLTVLLAGILRHWPLSGVLSDLQEPPLTPPTFDGHPGLLMLYGERLAAQERPGWVPEGPNREYLELVYQAMGKDCTRLLRAGSLATDVPGEETHG